MAAPELPDIFGNYVLGEEFVEVVSPAGVDWMPQTAGWWWLGAILALLLLRAAALRLRHWYHNRYRREALARLERFDNDVAPEQWLTELNRLLKLTALAAFPRADVAQLYGEDWTQFLDAQCESSPFSPPLRQLLGSGIYSGAVPAEQTRAELREASAAWISNHNGPTNV
ncbi:MAG: hypothetical protein Hals2KO_26650 [Halioglobus sp.]